MPVWRDARPDEDARVVAMSLALYAEDPSPEEVRPEQVERTLERLRTEPLRGRAVVLDDGGAILGYAILVAWWSNELGGEVCQVDELWVAPEARSRGAARALVEALARGDGPWPGVPAALQLEVSPSNRRARALYERLGFAPVRNASLRRRLRGG